MHVTLADVQGWLESTKLTLASVDAALEASAAETVFSSASRVYDTSTWVDANTTPRLIRQVIAMYVAGWTYNRQYSEDSEESNWWGDYLLGEAEKLLSGIVDGTIDLLDVAGTVGNVSGPTFYPNDATASEQVYDGLGIPVGYSGDADIKFRTSTRF